MEAKRLVLGRMEGVRFSPIRRKIFPKSERNERSSEVVHCQLRPFTAFTIGARRRRSVAAGPELFGEAGSTGEFLPWGAAGHHARDSLDRRGFDRELRVIGTDCGSPANFQADSIWWELENWRKLGVAPSEVIGAATTRGAALLRMPDVVALKVGARADFVLYQGSVTGGKFDVRRVRYVAKGGELFVKDGRWVGP